MLAMLITFSLQLGQEPGFEHKKVVQIKQFSC